MCQVFQTVSLPFTVKVQFSFSFIPFSLIYRKTTDLQMNSRPYMLPLQTYPFHSYLNLLFEDLCQQKEVRDCCQGGCRQPPICYSTAEANTVMPHCFPLFRT